MNNTTKILIAALGALTLSANAALVVNETFNYNTGTLSPSGSGRATTGTGLTGTWGSAVASGVISGNASGAIVNSWTYSQPTNYAPVPSANQFSTGGFDQFSAANLASSIGTTTDATYYLSFFYRVGTAGNVGNSYTQVGLANTISNNLDYFNIGKGSTASTFGIKFGPDGTEDTGVAIAANIDYFITAKLSILGSGTDSLSFKVFTSSDTLPTVEPITWDYTATASLGGSFTGIGFRNGGGQSNFRSDEFRLGTTWEAVAIPEPSTFALVGIALGSLLLFRRRKA